MWWIGVIAAAALIAAPSAIAQAATVVACQSQQNLQRVIDSDRELMPDGCRRLTVTEIDAAPETLCVIDFSTDDNGFLQRLRDAAMPEHWWVACDELSDALR